MSDHDPFSSASEEAPWEVLGRALAGEAAPGERAALARHLEAHPQRKALVDALEQGIAAQSAAPPEVDVDAALRSVLARRGHDELAARRAASTPSPARRRVFPAWAAAAAVVLLLAAGLLWRAQLFPRGEQRYATAVGARRLVRLSDGSEVLLGPGSELRVAAGYGRRARETTLSGEALFTVRHDAAHPFTVATREALLRDVGTRFSVRTGAAGAARVAVTEGAVQVKPQRGSPALLRAGDRARVSGAAVVVERGSADAADLDWVRGHLVFREAELAEVADALRRWYGVELRIPDPALAGRHITADFQGEPPAQVVRIIAATLGGEVERRGDTVFVVRSGGDPGVR